MANDISSALGAEGGGELVQALGQTWTFLPATAHIKSQYEAWLKLRARQSVVDQRELLDAMAYREAMGAVSADCAAGIYAWQGGVWHQSLTSPETLPYLLHLLLRQHHRDATPELAQRILEDNPEGLAPVMRTLLTGGLDPNRKAPASTPPGLSSR